MKSSCSTLHGVSMADVMDDMVEVHQGLSAGQPNLSVEAIGEVLGPRPGRDAASDQHSCGAAPPEPVIRGVK